MLRKLIRKNISELNRFNILENIKLVFYIGLFIRIILAVYTSQVHTWTKMISMDELVILGNDPFLRATAFGPLNYLFYMPTYAIYEFLRIIGIEYMFIALSLMRIPAILGDIILMFAVYQLIINLTNKKKLALFGASILFLNPYIIYTSSIQGWPESLFMGIMIFSIIELYNKRTLKSGILHGVASMMRYIPILLIPAFIIFILKSSYKNKITDIGKLLSGFILSIAIIGSVQIFKLIELYFNHRSAFNTFYNHVLGTGSAISAPSSSKLLEDTTFNLTAIFTRLGYWDIVRDFWNINIAFTIFYFAALIIFALSNKKKDSIIWFAASIFAMFITVISTVQVNYLMWLLPFLFIIQIISGRSKFLLNGLWIITLLIEPIIDSRFLKSYTLTTFPSTITEPLFYSKIISQSLSALLAVFLVCIAIICISGIWNKQNWKINNLKIKEKATNKIFIFGFIYFVVSILLIMNIPEIDYVSIQFMTILIIPITILLAIKISKDSHKLDEKFLNIFSIPIGILLTIIATVTVWITLSDWVIFLLFQSTIILITKNINFRIQRYSHTLTLLYLICLTVANGNILLQLITFIFSIYWIIENAQLFHYKFERSSYKGGK